MAKRALRVVLILNDSLLSLDVQEHLETCGHSVVGSVPHIRESGDLLRQRPDAAIVDVSLSDECRETIQTVRKLHADGVAVLLMSGHSPLYLPEALRDIPLCVKPAPVQLIGAMLNDLCSLPAEYRPHVPAAEASPRGDAVRAGRA